MIVKTAAYVAIMIHLKVGGQRYFLATAASQEAHSLR